MNNGKKVKLIGAIVGILLFVVCIAGVTYAWITWSSDNTRLSGKSGCFPDINYTKGDTLSADNVLLFDEDSIINNNTFLMKSGMTYLDVTASVNGGCNTRVALELEVNVTELSSAFVSGDSVGAFKYALLSYDPSTITDLSELVGKSLEIIDNNSITNNGIVKVAGNRLTTETKGYLLVFYVDGDLAFNDAQHSTFSATITGKAVQIEK